MIIGDYTLDGTPISKLSKASEKKVNAECDACGKHYTIIWHNYNLSQKRRNNSGLTICKSCASKETATKRRGMTPWNKGTRISLDKRKRSDYIAKDGYVVTYHPKDSEINDKPSWVNYKKLHRVIMEKILGRSLKKDERVHHIDGIKTNNSKENLWLAKGHSMHRKAHTSLQNVGYELYRKGIVIFDREKGIYKQKGDV